MTAEEMLDEVAFVLHSGGSCGEVCLCVDDARAVLALPAVRDALAAQEAVKRVEELHRPIDHEAYPAGDGEMAYCAADGYPWPCWTRRALDGDS